MDTCECMKQWTSAAMTEEAESGAQTQQNKRVEERTGYATPVLVAVRRPIATTQRPSRRQYQLNLPCMPTQ